jgi:hypothetical protein
MEAISIPQTTNTIIELITQPLSEKIKEIGGQIHDSLVHKAIDSATETIRNLSVWLEDLIWKSYVTSLLLCKIIQLIGVV